MFGRRKNRSSSVGSSRSGSAHCRICGAIHLDSDCAASENPPQTASTSQRTEGTMAVQNDGDLQVAHTPMEADTFKEGKEMDYTSENFPHLRNKLNDEASKLIASFNSQEESLETIQQVMKALKRKRQKMDMIIDHISRREGDDQYLSAERKRFHDQVKAPWDNLDARRREFGVEDGSSFYSSVSASPSNSSGISDTERRLAEAQTENVKAEMKAELKKREIELQSHMKMIQIEKELLDSQTKVKHLENQLALERNSQQGSLVGGLKPEEAIGRFPARDSILGTGNSRSYGRAQERSVARAEDAPFPGSRVNWEKPRSSMFPRGQHLASPMDSTAKFLLRDKLVTPNSGADVFKGDKAKFLSWIKRLMRECYELSLPAEDIIRVLRCRTEGKARKVVDLMDDCSDSDPQGALDKITETLYQRFGSGPEIAEDIRKKLENLTPIKASDHPEKIQELADLTTRIAFIMKQVPELADLNTATGISKIRKNLPIDMQRRWTTAGSKYKQRHPEEHPPFIYFAEWLEEQAKTACDPHFRIEYSQNKSKDQKKDKGGKLAKVLKTEKEEDDSKGQKVLKTEKSDPKKTTNNRENKQGKPDIKEESNCIFHPKGVHGLKDCRYFQSMPNGTEKDALTKWAKAPQGKSGGSSQQ